MIYVIKSGDTANDIAGRLTIGGTAYGPALINLWGFYQDNGDNYSSTDALTNMVGMTVEIPDNWLKTSGGAPITSGAVAGNLSPWILVAIAAAVLAT